MSEPTAGEHIGIPDPEHGDPGPAARMVKFGHPRGALLAIARYPLSTADVEADKLLASKKPIGVGGSYPVAQGGITPVGT